MLTFGNKKPNVLGYLKYCERKSFCCLKTTTNTSKKGIAKVNGF